MHHQLSLDHSEASITQHIISGKVALQGTKTSQDIRISGKARDL